MTTDNTWLPPTVNADVSCVIVLASGAEVLVSTSGLQPRELIPVQIWQGNAWVNFNQQGLVALTADQNTIRLRGPGQFLFNKPGTEACVGLYKDT